MQSPEEQRRPALRKVCTQEAKNEEQAATNQECVVVKHERKKVPRETLKRHRYPSSERFVPSTWARPTREYLDNDGGDKYGMNKMKPTSKSRRR